MTEKGVIGHHNRLLWHLPRDLKRFRHLTWGKPVIMGRKTFESIGKPLEGRQNIVLTKQSTFQAKGCWVVPSLFEAMALTQKAPEVMVIGGGEIYRLFLPLATHLYVTYVEGSLEGDISFPPLALHEWQETAQEAFEPDEKHAFGYRFVTYIRNTEDWHE